jgi:hypothetical protein
MRSYADLMEGDVPGLSINPRSRRGRLPPGGGFTDPEGWAKGLAIGWDIDSTLADTEHRHHMMDAIRAGGEGAPTWADYSMECVNDTVIEGSAVLMRLLAPHFMQVAFTAREACAAARTAHWVRENNLPLDEIVMRQTGDTTENGLFKSREMRRRMRRGLVFRLFAEDYALAAPVIREETGTPVLGITAFYPVPVNLPL